MTKSQETELEVAESKMHGTTHVGSREDKMREARLRWFEHVLNKENVYVGTRMMEIGLPIKRKEEDQKDLRMR